MDGLYGDAEPAPFGGGQSDDDPARMSLSLRRADAPRPPAGGVTKSLNTALPRGAGGVTGAYGPVKEAFNQRFTLVLGTAGDGAAQARNQANLEQFRKDWWIFAHTVLPHVTDVELLALIDHRKTLRQADTSGETLTAWDRALSGTLVCFGRPSTHLYLERVADGLPFHFLDDGYGVGGSTHGDDVISVQGGDLGFVGVYPRPDVPHDAARPHPYVAVVDGVYYGKHLSFNHKWDLVPDYLVFGETSNRYDGTNAARLAGFFDTDWCFDPALCWEFPPPPPEPTVSIHPWDRIGEPEPEALVPVDPFLLP